MSSENCTPRASASQSPALQTINEDDSDDFQLISVSVGSAPKAEPCTLLHGSIAQGVGEGTAFLPDHPQTPQETPQQAPEQRGFASQPLQNGQTDGIGSDQLSQWVQTAIKMQEESGSNFLDVVRQNKNFRNPGIMDKMVSYCGIDEFGTNLASGKPLEKHHFYEEIAAFQEVCIKESL